MTHEPGPEQLTPLLLHRIVPPGYTSTMSGLTALSEADILDRVIRADEDDMPPAAARALLQLKFDAEATRTIKRLLRANSAGTISTEDRLLLDRYLRVGQLIDLVQAKARLSLASSGT